MATNLFEQKYPNNIRTIIGLVNVIRQDDSVLLCDTSAGAVGIQLLGIPQGKWSTQWKLYIVDKSNNASVNNITIDAPVGFLINGASSYVMTANGSSFVVRVTSDTNFIGQYSVTSGGGGGVAGHVIQDEGFSLPQRLRLNFVGAGVTASDDPMNNASVVTISGASIVSLTNAQMLALITGSTVVEGQFYKITDNSFADLGVVIQGVKNNSVSIQGAGLFLNPDFQGVGVYTGVVGFAGQLGLWSTNVQAVVAGNVVIWNNAHYVNLTGAWGTAPHSDAVNWSVLAKSDTTGYILETDFVRYDVFTNTIIYRADKRENEVDLFIRGLANSLLFFQWGRDLVTKNKLVGSSIMYCTNSVSEFSSNIIHDGELQDYTLSGSPVNAGKVSYNVIAGGGAIRLGNTRGMVRFNNVVGNGSSLLINVIVANGKFVENNTILETSVISIDYVTDFGDVTLNNLIGNSTIQIGQCLGSVTMNRLKHKAQFTSTQIAVGGELENCYISDFLVNIPVVSISYSKRCVRHSYSNWQYTLDLDDPLIYAGNVLTMPPNTDFIGEFKCLNATGKNIIKIIGLGGIIPHIFMPDNTVIGNTLDFKFTRIAVAVAGDIIANHSVTNLGTHSLIAYADAMDNMTIWRGASGILNEATDKNVWQ